MFVADDRLPAGSRLAVPRGHSDLRGAATLTRGAWIGGTPLVELQRLTRGLPGRVAVKLESRNPSGSVKDRVAAALIEEAEARGPLPRGATVVAATSGNMGLALARIAAERGLRTKLAIPEDWCHERLALLLYLGADVVLTPGWNMRAAADRAREIAATLEGSAVLVDQFASLANRDVHRATTAEEIWSESGGEVAAFVAGVGTAGTISGVASGLRSHRPDLHVTAVEPAAAAVLSGGTPAAHGIQGIGAGFVPPLFDRQLVDEIVTVRDDEAFDWTQRLAREEGILAGVSSGAAVRAAVALAERKRMAGKLIVAVVSDSAERYVIAPRLEGARKRAASR